MVVAGLFCGDDVDDNDFDGGYATASYGGGGGSCLKCLSCSCWWCWGRNSFW